MASQRPRIVISCDGGGVRGAVTLRVLKLLRDELRLRLGRPDLKLHECVDLVVGTSVGGILCGLLCGLKLDIEQIEKMYDELCGKVFDNDNTSSVYVSITTKYVDEPLMKLLLGVFGLLRLDDEALAPSATQPRFALTAGDIRSDKQPLVLFANYDAPATATKRIRSTCVTRRGLLLEAVRATSAAPTYLHPYSRSYPLLYNTMMMSVSAYTSETNGEWLWRRCKTPEQRRRLREDDERAPIGRGVFIDGGGAGMNNPSLISFSEARALWPNERIVLLSMGTGKAPAHVNQSWDPGVVLEPVTQQLLGPHNLRQILGDLLKFSVVSTACDVEAQTDLLMALSGPSFQLIRLNPTLQRSVELDDASTSAVRGLRADADRWCAERDRHPEVGEAVAALELRNK